MGKHSYQPAEAGNSTDNELRTYPGPWKGQLVLACSKCRKKMKHSNPGSPVLSLKKALKKRVKRDGSDLKLRVISVSCLKMCPKDGVTVCTQEQLGNNQCAIVRTGKDIDHLYRQISRSTGI
jgi:hypothetical protein